MKKIAFTMAEILLSLTIIGVVAAITLPSLMGNINERTWNTQRKALHARMSQAIAMMPQLNGYGTLREGSGTEGTASYDAGEDTAAEAFITQGLSKVLKINNICDSEHLADCGLPEQIYDLNGSLAYSSIPKNTIQFSEMWYADLELLSPIGVKTAAYETSNGESVLVAYNQSCPSKSDEYHNVSDIIVCANFMYDLNGNKGPNTFGKDIGVITALYATDPVVVAPMPLLRVDGPNSHDEFSAKCTAADASSRLTNVEETMALFINGKLLGLGGNDFASFIASNTKVGQSQWLTIEGGLPGFFIKSDIKEPDWAYCIQR